MLGRLGASKDDPQPLAPRVAIEGGRDQPRRHEPPPLSDHTSPATVARDHGRCWSGCYPGGANTGSTMLDLGALLGIQCVPFFVSKLFRISAIHQGVAEGRG